MGIPVDDVFTPPSTQRAIVIDQNGSFVLAGDAPCAAMRPDQFCIRTEAVAINPSDTKMLGDFQVKGGILGTDFAGTVVAVGAEVRNVAPGDRVAGATHAMMAGRPDRGSFGQYNVNEGRIWLKLPPTISTEAGSTFPAGICTAGLAIRALGLPLPPQVADRPIRVLVYGGSTATGTIAMQLLRLAGLVPIATCSPHNFDLVRSYGAEEVYDYKAPKCAELIRGSTENQLAYALDCITTVESTRFCYAAIGRAGGRYVALDPFSEAAASRKAVKSAWVLGPSIFGEGSSWPAPYGRDGCQDLRQFGDDLFDTCQDLVDRDLLRPHPQHVIQGDMLTILEGLDLVKLGKLSGQKVVVSLN